jgi:hypothetical protein
MLLMKYALYSKSILLNKAVWLRWKELRYHEASQRWCLAWQCLQDTQALNMLTFIAIKVTQLPVSKKQTSRLSGDQSVWMGGWGRRESETLHDRELK